MKIKYFFWAAMIACITDLITATKVLSAESNPIYVVTGSIWPLVALKGIFITAFIFWYKRPNKTEHNYYYFCLAVMFSLILFSFGAWSNAQAIMDPTILEAGAAIPMEVKIQYYISIMSFIGVIPLILCLGTFELFYRTRKGEVELGK